MKWIFRLIVFLYLVIILPLILTIVYFSSGIIRFFYDFKFKPCFSWNEYKEQLWDKVIFIIKEGISSTLTNKPKIYMYKELKIYDNPWCYLINKYHIEKY